MSLYDYLSMHRLYYPKSIIDLVDSKIKYTKRKAFLLIGLGDDERREFAKRVAEWRNAEFLYFNCDKSMSKEEFLRKYLLPVAELSKTRKVVVLFDKYDALDPSIDFALSQFLQSFKVSVDGTATEANPENLVVFVSSDNRRLLSNTLMEKLTLVDLR